MCLHHHCASISGHYLSLISVFTTFSFFPSSIGLGVSGSSLCMCDDPLVIELAHKLRWFPETCRVPSSGLRKEVMVHFRCRFVGPKHRPVQAFFTCASLGDRISEGWCPEIQAKCRIYLHLLWFTAFFLPPSCPLVDL